MAGNFEILIGIDQTGAVRPGKPHLPRPLPCVLFNARTRELQVIEGGLAEFSARRLLELAGNRPATAVLLDCVIGLPSGLHGSNFKRALAQLGELESEVECAPFGRIPAEKFFEGLLSRQEPIPTRTCERIAGANSVFRSRPYQKNIQTGTYRLWREISRCRDQLALWPMDRRTQGRLAVFEGFPSLIWREHLGFGARRPAELPERLKQLGAKISRKHARLIREDADIADAAALAIGGWLLDRKHLLGDSLLSKLSGQHQRMALREGWIAGLIPSSSKVAKLRAH